MSPQDLFELMNAELDGVATPEQREALMAWLHSDPEAGRQFESLQGAVNALRSLPELDPPAGLSDGILARAAWRKPGTVGVFSKVFEAPMLRYAAAFALGMVLTGTLLDSPMDAPEDWSRMAGTMASTASGPSTEQSSFGTSGVGGTLQLQRSDAFLVLAVNLESTNSFNLVVPLSESLRVVGVLGSGEGAPALELTGGQLGMQLGGRQRFAVLMSGPADRVPYRIYRGEELIFEDFLPVPARE